MPRVIARGAEVLAVFVVPKLRIDRGIKLPVLQVLGCI